LGLGWLPPGAPHQPQGITCPVRILGNPPNGPIHIVCPVPLKLLLPDQRALAHCMHNEQQEYLKDKLPM
jgi:hypothetical protein